MLAEVVVGVHRATFALCQPTGARRKVAHLVGRRHEHQEHREHREGRCRVRQGARHLLVAVGRPFHHGHSGGRCAGRWWEDQGGAREVPAVWCVVR